MVHIFYRIGFSPSRHQGPKFSTEGHHPNMVSKSETGGRAQTESLPGLRFPSEVHTADQTFIEGWEPGVTP